MAKPNVKQLKRRKDVEGLISALQYGSDDDVRADAAFALSDIKADKRALEPLIRALKDKYFLVTVGAIKALGELKDATAVEPLIQVLLNNKTLTARSNSAVALGQIGDDKAVEPLIQTLRKDKVPEVRERAAWALREIKDKRAIGPLIQALKDKDWDVRGEAAGALGDIGEPAVQLLIGSLKDKNGDIRWGAAAILGHIGDKRALEPLAQALKDKKPNVRDEAARALEMIKKSKRKSNKP